MKRFAAFALTALALGACTPAAPSTDDAMMDDEAMVESSSSSEAMMESSSSADAMMEADVEADAEADAMMEGDAM